MCSEISSNEIASTKRKWSNQIRYEKVGHMHNTGLTNTELVVEKNVAWTKVWLITKSWDYGP